MNGENVSNEAETTALNKGAVSGSLSFDECIEKQMNWGQVIRFWKPNATDEDCQKIYDEMKKLAHKDAVLGRRDGATEYMVFDRIKYTYFRELNCH